MKILVLDGNSILNRAFYGIKGLKNKSGQPTNAIYGFIVTLNKLFSLVSPDRIAIAFDVKSPTFRHKIYSGYKAKRKGMPEELASQLPILKDLLKSLGYKIVECEGYEADDILGTIANICNQKKVNCVIATGDRDSLQLVSEYVTVRIASTKLSKPNTEVFDISKIKEVYGVTPDELIEIKAIQGDVSDNIPGVSGIGEKGANELIRKYHTIEYIYDNIDHLDIKDSIKKKLLDDKEKAFLSKELGTIKKDVPISTNLDEFILRERNEEEALNIMENLDLYSLIDKMFSKKEVFCDFKKGMFIANGKSYSIEDEDKLKLKKILEDDSIEKNTHDAKFLFSFGRENNIDIKNIAFDTMLAAYLIDPDVAEYDLETLFRIFKVKDYQGLINVLKDKLSECGQMNLLCGIEIPLSKVLVEMEFNGIKLNREELKEYSSFLDDKICKLQDNIFSYTGEFNVNSPKQLGEVLFEKLNLPHAKKTKRGYSTSAEVLEDLRLYHPVVDLILEYRMLAKLKSTYCDGILKVISKDGRVHTVFNQTETRTGRISSNEPNLQNIPIKSELGRNMRKFFTAEKGCLLISADYSQIELRVLAALSKDEDMKKAFLQKIDVHTITACKIFNMPENMITFAMRAKAKTINFAVIYGMGAFSLAKELSVTRKEAQKYIDDYFKNYSKIKDYLEKTVDSARKNGYVKSMFERRRYIKEIYDSNFNVRSFAERAAMNMPIQGTAADIIKLAMIKVYNRLKKENLKSKFILQVHDEIILEVPESESDYVKDILKKEMETCVDIGVPLEVKVGVGKTWYDIKD